jgi:CDP-glucose 4,6-dehydratase
VAGVGSMSAVIDVPNVAAAFAGRNVLVTGHTGFKGSWLSLWLTTWGARVHGLSLDVPTEPSNFHAAGVQPLLASHHLGDVRDREHVSHVVSGCSPDVVFHLAAQPLVLTSYGEPAETFDTNVMGTVNVLEAVRRRERPCAVVIVTSDKCYGGECPDGGFRESDAFGGHDPYSASKAATEVVVDSYRRSFFGPDQLAEHRVQLATVRAGNVIGGGDWSAYRIVPDVVAALVAGEPVVLRNPGAVRPWQHVLDPLFGYSALAANMLRRPNAKWCEGFNFGPASGSEVPVHDLVDQFIEVWGSGSWRSVSDHPTPYEMAKLRLNVDKVRRRLGYRPTFDVPTAIARTARWYRRHLASPTASSREACLDDIIAFEAERHRQLLATDSLPGAIHV